MSEKKYRLLKDSPIAPAGVEAVRNEDGNYVIMDMLNYPFVLPSYFVENNPEWFMVVKETGQEFVWTEWKEFSEWASSSDWTYLPSQKKWHNEEYEETIIPKTTFQLFEIFKKIKQRPETGIPTLDRQTEKVSEKEDGLKYLKGEPSHPPKTIRIEHRNGLYYKLDGERLYTEKEVLQREEDAFNAGRSGYSTYDHYHFHFLNFSDYKNKK